MGMAKKEIFNTQSNFFASWMKLIRFMSFEHFETKFVFFWGGGSVFNVFSSHSFFSFSCPFLQPVLLPTLLPFL